jgi:hypothetical protein
MYALGTMLLAIGDAAAWLAAAAPRPMRAPRPDARHPYREPGLPVPAPAPLHARALAQLAAQALLYDALLVAIVAAAMLVSA